jgi:hypothetical protein
MRTPDQDMAPAWQAGDSRKQLLGEMSWSCLGVLTRNRTSLICIKLCIYSHLETYTVLVEKLNRENIFENMGSSFLNDPK